MSDLLDKIRAAQRDAGERAVMDDLQKKLGGNLCDALEDLSSASPPPTTGGDTLIQRLRAYRGAAWETTECYNGIREEAALQIEALRHERDRYKQALQRANGFLIMHNLEPVKLEYQRE